MNTHVFQEECLYILGKDHYPIDKIHTGSSAKCLKAYFQLRDKCVEEMGIDEWMRRQGVLSEIRLKGEINMEIFRS